MTFPFREFVPRKALPTARDRTLGTVMPAIIAAIKETTKEIGCSMLQVLFRFDE